VLADYLAPNQGQDVSINDDSREAFVDNDHNGLVSVGDVFYGYLRIATPDPELTNKVYGVFSQTVTSAGLTGGTLGANNTGGGPTTLNGLTGLSLDPNAVFSVYEFNSANGLTPDLINNNSGTNTVAQDIAAVTAGNYLFSAGIAPLSDDYFVYNLLLPLGATPVSTLSTFNAFGQYGAGLTVFNNASGLTFNTVASGFGNQQVVVSGGIGGRPYAGAGFVLPTDAKFTDTATFTVNVTVPEPASIAAWSLIGLVFGGAGLLRRRASK